MNNLFEDIAPIGNKISISFWETHWWIIAASLFLLAAVCAFLLLRRKKIIPLSAYEIAQMRLKNLNKESAEKAYIYAVSSILRDYIGAVFNLPAPERTTEEFLELTKVSKKLDENARLTVIKILKFSDLVKFANLKFDEAKRSEIFSLIDNFIEEDNKNRIQKTKDEK